MVLEIEGGKVDCMQRQWMAPHMLASQGGFEVLMALLVDQVADKDRRVCSSGFSIILSLFK